ncbi:hypothetical protein [Daejeonella sp.]|uniref:hypothetical protein n=1 Tax=Daejeonella sp. TaxID=2805397 RepID=UPI00271B04BF|nr:hypothetical protein [Daejeonella sp.]MDO8993514.1 hypothetical protein [Daejeonella sp.]MDP2415329.1 hypothetical protein [Daejeonella sp.]
MKTYILFFIVFLLSFTAYSQTGGGMRRGGGRGTGTQTMGTEGQRTGQRPAEGVKGKKRRQGGDCNPGGRGTGIDAGGTSGTGVRTRTGIGTRTGAGTKISQPNIRTNTGVRSF